MGKQVEPRPRVFHTNTEMKWFCRMESGQRCRLQEPGPGGSGALRAVIFSIRRKCRGYRESGYRQLKMSLRHQSQPATRPGKWVVAERLEEGTGRSARDLGLHPELQGDLHPQQFDEAAQPGGMRRPGRGGHQVALDMGRIHLHRYIRTARSFYLRCTGRIG